MAKADYSDFLSRPPGGRQSQRARALDDATRHLQIMFKVNTLVRVVLPAIFAVTMAAQLSAGISDRVEMSFGALDQLRLSLGGDEADTMIARVGKSERDRLFAHLRP